MESRTYGYIRVSTKEQNEDRQVVAMRQFGVEDCYIFMDKQSGKDFNRPAYKRLVRKLREGDTLVVKSIDRLGRNYDETNVKVQFWQRKDKEEYVHMVLLILGAVMYIVVLTVILSLMRASSAADEHAERVFPEWQAGQCELEQQKQE